MKLDNFHKEKLIDELENAINELSIFKECLKNTELGIKQRFEVAILLTENKIELIKKLLTS